MTKCSWKTGLFLLAGAFILTFSASAFAADDYYRGSNSAVNAATSAFNGKASKASANDAKELEAKKKDLYDQKMAKYIEFKTQEIELIKVVAQGELEVTLGQGKEIGDNYVGYVKALFDANGYFWSGDMDNVLASAKEGLKKGGQVVSGLVSTLWDKSVKLLKAQTKPILDTIATPSFVAARWSAEIDNNYSGTSKYTSMMSIVENMKKIAAEYENINDNYKAIAKNISSENLYYYLNCPTGADGKQDANKCEKIFYTYDGTTAETVSGNLRGCIPLQMKLAESRSCIFCPLFKTIFNTAQDMTTKSYTALAKSISNVLLVGFALWVAFSLLGKVSSFTKMDAPKYITELLVQAFKVLVAYLLLRDATAIYAYIVGPLLKAGMEFGMTLLSSGNSTFLKACDSKDVLNGLTGGMLPAYLYTQLECFIQAVQAELAIPQTIGSSLMCFSRSAGSIDLGAFSLVTDYRLPDFGILIQGLVIWVFAWLISLAFAFYLIDATVRLGIVGALMPFLIASWPFKMTSKYTSTGFTMFMNTFFTYVFMGLVVSVNIKLMGESLNGVGGGFDAIAAALNGNAVADLKNMLDIGFAGFLILIASCIFGFKLTGQATELAGTMAGGGGGTAIAPGIGGMGASVAKAGTLGAGKMAWGGTKMLGNATGVTPKLRQARDKVGAGLAKMFGFGGSSGGAASTTSSSPATPSKSNPAPTSPSNTPPVTKDQAQQADQVANANPRNQNTDSQVANPQTQQQQPKPTTAPSQQKPTTAPAEQKPDQEKPKPRSPEELHQQYLKDFEQTNAGNAINQAISQQTAMRNDVKSNADTLRNQMFEARKDVLFFETAARDAKASDEMRASMTQNANEARQRAKEFETQQIAEEQKMKAYDDRINSLNDLKNNTAQQYVGNKTDAAHHAPVNEQEIINQVNNMTI